MLSCNSDTKIVTKQIQKIVKDKKEATQTSYRYKYNIFKGDFYHVPNVRTVYYIVYNDGSYDEVNLGKYIITNIGDTIIKNISEHQIQ